jgi:hypothetical protein
MQEETAKKLEIIIEDPETGDKYNYNFDGAGDMWQDGEKWGVNVSITTTKTQLVLFELARFMASQNEGSPLAAEARRILRTVYHKLDFFTIEAAEDGKRFLCSWKTKEGLKGAAIDKEMEEVLNSDLFKVIATKIVLGEQRPEDVAVVKGGGGVRVGAQWGKARFEVKKAKKEKRKASPEDMPFEFTLLKLLRDFSTHRDKEHELYLLGNGGEEFEEVAAAIVGQEETFSEFQRVAVMEIPQTELYKAYTGKPSAAISSGERRRVDKLLETFQSDIVTAIIKEPQANKTVKWYEMAGPKITVARVATLTEAEAATREAGGDLPEAKTSLKIRFHPAFTFDIREKYGLLPDDYLQRMKKAIGGRRSGNKCWLLVDYLNGIRGHGKASGYETLLDFDTAALLLDLELFKKKQGIPATTAEIDEAARVAQEIGLVLSWTKEPGARGQRQYQFKLNPEFGKE